MAGGSSLDVGRPVTDSRGLLSAWTRSPGWSEVVKRGQRLQGSVNAAAQMGTRAAAPGRKKRTARAVPIVGTGVVSGIQTVKTKLVSVFATKFSPDLDAGTLSSYLKGKLGREVQCQKIDTVHSRFGSFKVSAECNEVGEMYIPELWPDGALVRRYYEPRREGVVGVNTAARGIGVPAGALITN